MSRSSHDDMHAGSDSFLDVMANMVGILIILLVIAGSRAGQQAVEKVAQKATEVATPPVSPPPVPVASATPPPEVKKSAPIPAVPESLPVTDATPVPTPKMMAGPGGVQFSEEPPAPLPEPTPPAELIVQQAALTQEAEGLSQEARDQQQKRKNLTLLEQKLRLQLRKMNEQLANRNDELQSAEKQLAELQQLVERDWTRYSGLLAEFESTKQAKAPVKELKHRLTPVSRVVTSEELHFRLEKGRVAYVPVTELTDRLLHQVERQKDWIVKFRTHRGTVGPLEGFRMEYVVQRQSTVLDDMRPNPGMVRIGVAGWELQPEEDLETETATDALRPGSKFANRLQQSSPNAALTFWVYPDSFPEYRKLQTAAHAAGFTVSGRPLPEGMPISGSPNGSRSAGQ